MKQIQQMKQIILENPEKCLSNSEIYNVFLKSNSSKFQRILKIRKKSGKKSGKNPEKNPEKIRKKTEKI